MKRNTTTLRRQQRCSLQCHHPKQRPPAACATLGKSWQAARVGQGGAVAPLTTNATFLVDPQEQSEQLLELRAAHEVLYADHQELLSSLATTQAQLAVKTAEVTRLQSLNDAQLGENARLFDNFMAQLSTIKSPPAKDEVALKAVEDLRRQLHEAEANLHSTRQQLTASKVALEQQQQERAALATPELKEQLQVAQDNFQLATKTLQDLRTASAGTFDMLNRELTTLRGDLDKARQEAAEAGVQLKEAGEKHAQALKEATDAHSTAHSTALADLSQKMAREAALTELFYPIIVQAMISRRTKKLQTMAEKQERTLQAVVVSLYQRVKVVNWLKEHTTFEKGITDAIHRPLYIDAQTLSTLVKRLYV